MEKQDLTGKVFGRWTVLKQGTTVNKRIKWICQCTCGTIKEVIAGNLQRGISTSCGCKWYEPNTVLIKHGKTGTKEYAAWNAMRQRCTNPKVRNYDEYGGRGITYDPSWNSFEEFYRDMGDAPSSDHSLDRIDNDKGYDKENCRWATSSEQALNRRVCLKTGGKTQLQLARELGISPKAYRFKKRNGLL